MYKFLIIFFLCFSSLYAINPKAYASLGDKIYNNAQNIKKLTSIGDYYLYSDDINAYLKKVTLAKQKGLMLDANSSADERKKYLATLRQLSSLNDYYVHMAETSLKNSIANQDSLLFSKIINTGLIDLKAHKKEILDYYFAHSNEVKADGAIKEFLDKSSELKRKRKEQERKERLKKLHEQEKIQRLRQRDKKRQLELEEKLDKAVEKKKMEIRKEQKEELIKSI